jgi:hypothetical protein
MLYFQIYLFIGIVYTSYVYVDFSDALLNQMKKEDPSLYSMHPKEFYVAAMVASLLLLMFLWPLLFIETLIRSIK